MAAGQIPAASVSRYCAEYDFGGDARDFFRAIIRHLDNIYLGYKSSQQQQPQNDNVVDSARIDDHVGVSAILKRLGKKPTDKK